MNLKTIKTLISSEEQRQNQFLSLIASENHCSKAVREALGSRLTDKYAEGYPGKRYYHGCEVVDEIETLAINAVCGLFGAQFANVQPHSGSQANEAVFMAFLQPGDRILSLDLSHGGHLTHGYKANSSGKFYEAHHYVTDHEGLIDLEHVADMAQKVRPKLIIAGASTYSRLIDWAGFRKIADEVGAFLLADVAHFSGLIAGGCYPNPCQHADVVTSSTHKVMRGPRGGMILWNKPEYSRKINSAVFPGIQGGPLMHSIAGKAVCFLEAATQEYREYCAQVVKNARFFAKELVDKGMKIVSGGTDCHMFVVDLSEHKISGMEAANKLNASRLVVSKQLIPADPLPPHETSGIRIGTAAITSRGMKENEVKQLANMVYEIVVLGKDFSEEVGALCREFALG